tara:strand:+ start:178 stop:444 length:267 start_codon:yes stop_codon:yes gene_type:complete
MAKKNYSPRNANVPNTISSSVIRKDMEKMRREEAERTSDSDVPQSDKDSLKNMIEEEGGQKYAKGGLVRGSVRGGGVALRGLGRGKVY